MWVARSLPLGSTTFRCSTPTQIQAYSIASTHQQSHWQNILTSEPRHHITELLAPAITAFGLVTTLTFDLSPWKPFQQCPLTRWILVASFIQIIPLRPATHDPSLSAPLKHSPTLTLFCWPTTLGRVSGADIVGWQWWVVALSRDITSHKTGFNGWTMDNKQTKGRRRGKCNASIMDSFTAQAYWSVQSTHTNYTKFHKQELIQKYYVLLELVLVPLCQQEHET